MPLQHWAPEAGAGGIPGKGCERGASWSRQCPETGAGGIRGQGCERGASWSRGKGCERASRREHVGLRTGRPFSNIYEALVFLKNVVGTRMRNEVRDRGPVH